MSTLEHISAACNVAYVLLIGKKSVGGWVFGIIGAALGSYLLFTAKLYFDTFLYGSYVLMCMWGLGLWLKGDDTQKSFGEKITIHQLGYQKFSYYSATMMLLSVVLGFFASTYTDAAFPYADAPTRVFGLGFTWMQGKGFIENWPGFVVINFLSALLYLLKDLNAYAIQMLIFNALALRAWHSWTQSRRQT